MTNTTTNNTPDSPRAPLDVLREMDRFEAAMRRAFNHTPDRNMFGEVVPHIEEAYQAGRDSDRFMGFCMAVAAGSGGKTIPSEELLDIARETGLRSFLHGVNATDAREILARYQLAVDVHRESLPADATQQVSKWVYDATRQALDSVHAVALRFGCPRGETVADWLRARLASPPVEQRAPMTAQDALAAIETFEIVGENNSSHDPNADDRFILTEFIAHLFGSIPVEEPAAAPIDVPRYTQADMERYGKAYADSRDARRTAPAPTDERAAFDVWYERAYPLSAEVLRTGACDESIEESRDELAFGFSAGWQARAASTSKTWVEGAHLDALILAYGKACHESASAAEMDTARDALKVAILSHAPTMDAVDARRMRTLCRLLDAMDEEGNGFPGELHAAFQHSGKQTRAALDVAAIPEDYARSPAMAAEAVRAAPDEATFHHLFSKHGGPAGDEGWCINESGLRDFLRELYAAPQPPAQPVAWWRSPHQIISDHEYRTGVADEIKPHYRALGFMDTPQPPAQADARQLGNVPEAQREHVCQAIAEALGDAYDCTRVWSAWAVGTMGPDDFRPVADDLERVAEIADAAIGAVRAAPSTRAPNQYGTSANNGLTIINSALSHVLSCTLCGAPAQWTEQEIQRQTAPGAFLPGPAEPCNLGRHELDALRAVVRERRRQIADEDYTPEHDDSHVNGEIAALAAVYAMPPGAREWPATETGYGDSFRAALLPDGWCVNTGNRDSELVKAGALVLAELGRRFRAARAGGAA